ncbi:nitrate reductase [Enterovirga rhinocerotis]|uniref:Assimilatory nitrate reductase (NADH) alpha subunit apoprotein n=1 Tax=Enterovirga rhinocerotis TaxID=1339210 RepID=A0A4R7BJP9_9HYPH|nr:nitrate reductase [Enterovirga rhinocerotis]TDR85498.1 assimilatory nitrate reductase (NADH) alpha subunit apoprotein [Enterovirga rhinocerotis]
MNAHPGPVAPPAIRTTCPYCGVGCGVLARPDGLGGLAVEGDPDHPANCGRLCSKGSALGETVGLEGRLLHPMVEGRRASWDDALGRVAGDLSRIVAEHGPDAVAFYLSGQLLTEDYYVANKLMKGFVGSGNVDTNSRLCMSSSVAGHRRAFGADIVPGCYADLDEADLIVLVGSNAAWCHPILFRRMLDNRARRGAKIVVVDPRRSASADEADLFLPVAAGQDTALFCGLLVHLAESGALDADFLGGRTEGFGEALARAREIAPDPASVARATGIAEADLAAFYDLFRTREKVVTCYSQGVNQSAQGTDKVGAIVNCHLATGRIGRPGMGPLSLTGQPNAMGGREVGGLANMLAAHMNYLPAEIDRVGRFWDAPRMARREGLKAVALFDAIDRGEVRALWVMATNPAVSLPDADRVRASLAKLDLLVVSENVASNDTTSRGAHVLLPAAAWGEKDGTVTNSERRISRQRAVLPLPGEAKPDWWIVSAVAARMGFASAFPYRKAADIFREHAALTAFENGGERVLDLGGLADLGDRGYDDLAPVQWPVGADGEGTARLFAERPFQTPDGRARFVAPALPRLATETSEAYPFVLNTGRIRDQWHTMTRSGRSPRLGSHRPAPFVELHPADAARLGLGDGDLARVSTAMGSCVLETRLAEGQPPGTLFSPIHWSGETSSDGRIGALVHDHVDPFSGQPEMKASPAAITPEPMPLRGFLLSRLPIGLPDGTWWARAAIEGGTGTLFAARGSIGRIAAWAPALVPGAEIADYLDAGAGVYRLAAFVEGRLEAVFFAGPAAARPHWEAARALFAAEAEGRGARQALSGRNAGPDPGPLVCACFGVGLATICDAIRTKGATSTEAIGAALRAGTNCGSCLPELRRILASEAATPANERLSDSLVVR